GCMAKVERAGSGMEQIEGGYPREKGHSGRNQGVLRKYRQESGRERSGFLLRGIVLLRRRCALLFLGRSGRIAGGGRQGLFGVCQPGCPCESSTGRNGP